MGLSAGVAASPSLKGLEEGTSVGFSQQLKKSFTPYDDNDDSDDADDYVLDKISTLDAKH